MISALLLSWVLAGAPVKNQPRLCVAPNPVIIESLEAFYVFALVAQSPTQALYVNPEIRCYTILQRPLNSCGWDVIQIQCDYWYTEV